MNDQELKEFVEMDKAIGEYIGKTVTVHGNFGWVNGILTFDHSWKVSSYNCSFDFDTDDVESVSASVIKLDPRGKY